MHVCMIDENSHCPQQQPKSLREQSVFSLENVHPSKVFLTSTGIASSFSSQEPRRPRFSFFHLHNFKELTSGPAAGRRRWKQRFRILANRTFSPVARQQVCPFRIVEQWERSSLDVVNVAGCSRDVFVCQHPIFDFRFLPNFEKLNSLIS